MKYLTLLGLLLILVDCQSKKETDKSDKDTTALAAAHPLPNCKGTEITINATNSTLIDSAQAAIYYIAFKEQIVKQRGRMKYADEWKPMFCDGLFRYFKYGLFQKNTLEAHLCIDEKSLVQFAKRSGNYHGIRLYPCLANKKVAFLFVFTEQQNNRDIDSYKKRIVLYERANLRDRICAIFDDQRPFAPLTSHRLCTPNCPEDDDLLADY